jgi:hypothetical protein
MRNPFSESQVEFRSWMRKGAPWSCMVATVAARCVSLVQALRLVSS